MIMKLPERFQFLANVLIVTCSRPNAEVGKLVKATVTYVTEGTKTDLDDLRLQAYYDLLIQDIDSMRAAAEAKSRKCSESAKCRSTRNTSSIAIPAKKTNAANATSVNKRTTVESGKESQTDNTSDVVEVSMGSKQPDDSISSKVANDTEGFDNFNASDVTSSFDRLKVIYKKVGDNESQAFGVWQQLSESERKAAFAHTQRLQGDLSSRSYLYVYLRDRVWTKATSPYR